MADPITVKITNLNSPIATVKVSSKLAESAVTSVAGRVGDILLTQADVAGLENVNNTSDLDKPVSTATQQAIDNIDLSGYALVDHQHILADITNAGTAAAADTGDFATASHTHLLGDITDAGTAAGSDTGDFAPFIHQHVVSDITDLNTGEFATSAQGVLADSSLQSGDNVSSLNNDAGYLTSGQGGVNADWNATSGQAEILNKPTLGTIASQDSGDYALTNHDHVVADILDLLTGEFEFTNKTLADTSNKIHADQIHLKVKADEDLLKGQPVKYDSFQIGEEAIRVSLANQLTDISIGLAEDDIDNGQFGHIITAGILSHVNTQNYTEGEVLYVDGLGQLTGVEPSSGYAQPIAVCLKSQQNNGALQVLADYPKQPSTDVRNDSAVSGLNVTEALDNLKTSVDSIDPDNFALSGHDHVVGDVSGIKDAFGFACSDETSSLSIGQAIATDMPYDMLIDRVYASLASSGSLSDTTIDVKKEGSSILNSTLSISSGTNNAETSLFSGSAATFSLSKGDLLTIDITTIDTAGTDAGLKVYLEGEIN